MSALSNEQQTLKIGKWHPLQSNMQSHCRLLSVMDAMYLTILTKNYLMSQMHSHGHDNEPQLVLPNLPVSGGNLKTDSLGVDSEQVQSAPA